MAEETELFAKGDLVVLKSGGPKMTVVTIRAPTLHCAWFFNGLLSTGEFSHEALRRPKEKD